MAVILAFKRTEKGPAEDTTIEEDMLAAAEKRNAIKAERLRREREQANRAVIRSHKLKKK